MTQSPAILLLIITYFSGSPAQYVLTQPPSVSVSLGETGQLSCSGDLVSKKYVQWYQQSPGLSPRLIIYEDNKRPDNISDRISGSSSGNTAVLTITNVQPQDDADYYCEHWHDDSSSYVFGTGTYLSVLGQPKSQPNVNLYSTPEEERKNKNKVTVVCTADEFYPREVTFTWQADDATVTSGVQTSPPSKVNDKYAAVSYLTLDISEWERHDRYTCKVTHEGSEYPKTINREGQCP